MRGIAYIENSSESIELLLKWLAKEKRSRYRIYLLRLIQGLHYIAIPLGVQVIITFAIAGKFTASLMLMSLGTILATLFVGVVQIWQMRINDTIHERIFAKLTDLRNIIIILISFCCSISMQSQTNNVFSNQSFGKGTTVIYIGSGAIKRHLDLNKQSYSKSIKSPSLVLGVDKCFYPYARNAYLGIGPVIIANAISRESNQGENSQRVTYIATTVALKLTHHFTYFVRNKMDLCTGYLVGFNFNAIMNSSTDGEASVMKKNMNNPDLALAFTLTARYYVTKSTGLYVEGGIGYRLHVLNVGICKYFKN